jgi:hypothetical protein
MRAEENQSFRGGYTGQPGAERAKLLFSFRQ